MDRVSHSSIARGKEKLPAPGGRWWFLALLIVSGAIRSVAADSFASAYISEIQAEDPLGSKDEDGDRSGWVEITNGGNQPVNLAGWFLTDDPGEPAKWRFPSVVLLPDKSLVVFASGKNRTSDLLQLHAVAFDER